MGHIPVAKPSPIPRWKFPRRGLSVAFILAGFVVLVTVVATTAYPIGSKIDDGPRWESIADASELQVGEPVHVFSQKLWLVKLDSGEVLALSHKSPHMGCTIPWRPDFEFDGRKGWFRDPCSGSTFDIEGVKAFGSAPRNMDGYETRVFGGAVQVRVEHGALLPAPVATPFNLNRP